MGTVPNASDLSTSKSSHPTDRHQSIWTFKEHVGRAIWNVVQNTLFRAAPANFYGYRAFLLRLFGAKLAAEVRIRRSVTIAIPWHLEIGRHTAVGDGAILYSLGKIRLGQYVTISQYAHLCAGTHETNTRAMLLLTPPIEIGDDVWVAADAFIGPGVTIGDRAIVGARASVFSDLPADVIVGGNPAKVLGMRAFTAEPLA